MMWVLANWDVLVMGYCFFVLFFLPVSSERLRLVDFFIALGAAGLLVIGCVRLAP
jgi:hypothetical protein